jgi:uncharacterized protein (DUF58 family)
MNATALNRLLPPTTLAGLANLELVARTAVEGFLTGLHRSPHYGFSQEFKEYRAYVEGDDPRFVDWNVYARTERTYIRRYEGETNTRLMILLDASASMDYSSGGVSKLQYGKFLAAALAYLAARQHDPVGLIVFDEQIRQFRPATSRAGSLQSMIHTIDAVTAGRGTNLEECFRSFGEHLKRRGLVAVISDLYCDPLALSKAVQPLAYHGHDIMLFQLLDPRELQPDWSESVLLEDVETHKTLNVAPEYLAGEYRDKLGAHLASLRKAAADVPRTCIPARLASDRRTDLAAPCRARKSHAASVRVVDVRRGQRDAANGEAHAALLVAVVAAHSAAHRARACICRAAAHRAGHSGDERQCAIARDRARQVAVDAGWRSLAARTQ